MARPKSVDDETILQAARKCFLEHGAGVSTAVIARELRVSHTTIFNRFGTKERLMVEALCPPRAVPWLQRLREGPDERPIVEQLTEIGVSIIEFFRAMIPRLEILWAAGITPKDVFADDEVPAPLQAHQALAEWFRQAAESGAIRGSDPEVLAMMTIGAFRSKPFTERICGLGPVEPADTEAYVRKVCEVLLDGIG